MAGSAVSDQVLGQRSMWLCFDLVDGGYLSSTQAMRVLNRQLSYRSPIGQLAVEREWMTMSQVFEVLSRQGSSPMPFGELAIEMGFLDREQLGDLLLDQLSNIPSLEELIVSEGMMTEEEIENAVTTMRREGSVASDERQFEIMALS